MTISRFASFAIIAIAALLSGCAAGTMGGAVSHRGPHHNVTLGGVGTNAVPQPVMYGGGQPVVVVPRAGYGHDPYSAEACPSGYRQFNGVYRCMDNVDGQMWQPAIGPQVIRSGGMTFCRVRVVSGNQMIHKLIKVATPSDCLNLGELVEEARGQQAPATITPRTGSASNCRPGTTWSKLDWPGHHQNGQYVCLPKEYAHRAAKSFSN